jgi:hypothetical protein
MRRRKPARGADESVFICVHLWFHPDVFPSAI